MHPRGAGGSGDALKQSPEQNDHIGAHSPRNRYKLNDVHSAFAAFVLGDK
jgi:hypothetical protein